MKLNEAPEKLYFGECDKGLLDIYSKRESDNDIEYIRTDAFIKKACEWLYDNLHWADPSDFLEDFENYMKD